MSRRPDRILTYQSRTEGEVLAAHAYPVTRAALARIFEDHLLARKVFIRATGRPARHTARILEGLGHHPRTAGTLVGLDGEEFLEVARKGEDRFERFATFEFFDASLRAKGKDARAGEDLSEALGTEIEAVIFADRYVRLRTRRPERLFALLRGLLERFLKANGAPRPAPLPDGIAAKLHELSQPVGLSLAPESIEVSEQALGIAIWRGRIRLTGVEAPPFVCDLCERAYLRCVRRDGIWQVSDAFRPADCRLGALGYSRERLLECLASAEPAERSEAFERLAVEPVPEDLGPLLAALEAETDPRARAAAIRAAGAHGDPAAREALFAGLEDPSEAVRIAAAEAAAPSRAGEGGRGSVAGHPKEMDGGEESR